MKREKLKKIVTYILVLFRIDRLLHILNKTPRVVFWHSVDVKVDRHTEPVAIQIDEFEAQLNYLEKHYEIISCDEFTDRFIKNSFTNKEVVLTFDDGYRNNMTVLAPLLKKRNIPFVVFISTNHIKSGDIFPTSIISLIIHGSYLKRICIPFLNIDRDITSLDSKLKLENELITMCKTANIKDVEIICNQMRSNMTKEEFSTLFTKHPSLIPMNWDEVKQISDFRGEIGCHCIDHICCHENQDINEVRDQIEKSKLIIEKQLGVECKYFAYPNGSFTEASNEIVNSCGFTMGFTTKPHKIDIQGNKAMIPRICAPSDKNIFKIKLNLFPL